ncbi:hypothetical protein [Arthrobacter sp. CAN_C5]|uniref:hypothetical protein n=1 Tax=Arthrobacter sp. CAN_C5 TaxID=2760706 RepID=UPI001AE75CE5|nr:hypothetical protein [Arthrobacter sp. CAN_C5]MBP2216315.1 hypothetical protein [Arthrobacter sp. CAN_C5]
MDRVRDYLATQVTTPSPTIPSLTVSYDPRLQLGAVIIIDSAKLMSISLRSLIVEKSYSAGTSDTRELGVVIITAKITFTTYAGQPH